MFSGSKNVQKVFGMNAVDVMLRWINIYAEGIYKVAVRLQYVLPRLSRTQARAINSPLSIEELIMFNAIRFRNARVAAHIGQLSMSRTASVSISTLRRWERGDGEPTLVQLTACSMVNNVTVAYMLADEVALTPSAAIAVAALNAEELIHLENYRTASEMVRRIIRATLGDLIAVEQATTMR